MQVGLVFLGDRGQLESGEIPDHALGGGDVGNGQRLIEQWPQQALGGQAFQPDEQIFVASVRRAVGISRRYLISCAVLPMPLASRDSGGASSPPTAAERPPGSTATIPIAVANGRWCVLLLLYKEKKPAIHRG